MTTSRSPRGQPVANGCSYAAATFASRGLGSRNRFGPSVRITLAASNETSGDVGTAFSRSIFATGSSAARASGG